MITCTILCILLGIYSASSTKTNVTLNLCKINDAQFRKEAQSSPNYNEFLLFPKDQYDIVEVVDSGIDIWKKLDESILQSVDVYYKEFIPQLVILNIKRYSFVAKTYFKRDKGKFTEISRPEFRELAESNDFLDRTLKLDLQRGFCNRYFTLTRTPIDNIPFDQYELKYDLVLLTFTNGSESFMDVSRDEVLVRMLRLKVNQNHTLLQIITRNELLSERSFYYEFRDTNWKPLNAVDFKKLCIDITSSNEPRVQPSDGYGSGDESVYEIDEEEILEAEGARRTSEALSDVSPEPSSPEPSSPEPVSAEVEEPPTLGETVGNSIAIKLKYKRVPSEAGSDPVGELRIRGRTDVRGDVNEEGKTGNVFVFPPKYTGQFGFGSVPPSRRPTFSIENEAHFLSDDEVFDDSLEDDVFEPEEAVPTVTEEESKKRKNRGNDSDDEEDPSSKNVDPRPGTALGEEATVRPLAEILGKDLKTKMKQARQELEDGDSVKPVQEMKGNETVLETGFHYGRFGMVEDSEENDCESTEEGMKEVRPQGTREDVEEESPVPPVSPVSHNSHHSHQSTQGSQHQSHHSTHESYNQSHQQSHGLNSRHQSQDSQQSHGSQHSERSERPTTPESTHSQQSYSSRQSQTSTESPARNLTLFLDGGDDTYAFTITTTVFENGIVEKIFKPKKHRLIAVKYTLPLWVAELNEVKCKEAVVHKYNEEVEAVMLNIALENGFTKVRYYNPSRFTEIVREDHEELLKALVKKANDPRSKEIELVLDYVSQAHVDAIEVTSQYSIPYKKYRPDSGYRITRVSLGSRQVWRADERYPYADSVTYYTHFNRPAYLVLNIPEANYFIKTVTIDLVKSEKIAELTEEQLGHLLDRSLLYHNTVFDLSEPIDREEYRVEKADFRGFIVRNFTKLNRRVTIILDNKARVTPTNIIPFAEFKVYYYRNLPVMLLTDPLSDPKYFSRLDLGWEATSLARLTQDLEAIKQNLSNAQLHPSTFVDLNYDLQHNEGFLVESGVQNGLHYRSFLPVMGNILVSIYCREGFVLSEEENRKASGVKFFLRDNRPYKAELLINRRGGLKKYVFKVLEPASGRWTQVDESLFDIY